MAPRITPVTANNKPAKVDVKKMIDSAFRKYTTARGELQKALIQTVIHSWQTKNTGYVQYFLEQSAIAKGSLRVESIAFWLSNVAGFEVEYHEKTGFKVKMKNPLDSTVMFSGEFVKFTRDKAHVALLKEEKLFFWNIAPVEIKLYKVADIDKVTQSTEVQLARLLETGEASEDDVKNLLQGMFDRVMEARNSTGVKKWVKTYQSQQHPELDSDGVGVDLDEAA